MAETSEDDREKANGVAGILKGLANLVETVGKMEKEGLLEIKKSGKIGNANNVKALYSYKIQMGLDGYSGQGRPARVLNQNNKTPGEDDEREPIVDIIPEDDHFLIIAEMHGVEEPDVNIRVNGGSVLITAHCKKSGRRYRKEITLEGLNNPVLYTTNYRNGIVEIKVKRNK